MLKEKQKVKKKIRWDRLWVTAFVVLMPLYIVTSLFVRTYNNNLAVKLQSMERDINTLKLENAEIKSKIQELTSKQRVMEVAEIEELYLNQDNVLTILPSSMPDDIN